MPAIMGLDLAGEVAEIGENVEGWAIGDRVLVDPIDRVRGGLMGETLHGGLAERCRAGAHQLIRMPDGVSFADAAALPVAYGTAHRMMVTRGRVAAGERVLILGASGGVGTCCVFLARMAGATVVACASSEAKVKRLYALGADHVIDYARGDFMAEVHTRYGKPQRRRADGGVDVVINFTGGDTWVPSLRCLRRGGRLLTCGATAGFDPKTDIRYIWTFELSILGSNGWMQDDLVTLLSMVDEGRLSPVIDRVVPLADAREGLRLLADREVIGKVIVEPG
jgi:alcohol dehydrogenase